MALFPGRPTTQKELLRGDRGFLPENAGIKTE